MDDLKDYTLAEFIAEQSTNFQSALPIVHSSESKNLRPIIAAGKIAVTQCDTFTGESLAYFFHGRPSYRKAYDQPKDWQLPFVLVLKRTCLLNVKRIFPFDSGAFFSNRLPRYLSDFKVDGYDVAPNGSAAIDLLIDIFFGGDEDYLHARARPFDEVKHRRKLGVGHSEIQALCAMYNRDQVRADDRAFAIEIQSDQDVAISDHLVGVVMPRPYFDDPELKQRLKDISKLQVRSYDVFPLSTEAYMAVIYQQVKEIYKKLGVINA